MAAQLASTCFWMSRRSHHAMNFTTMCRTVSRHGSLQIHGWLMHLAIVVQPCTCCTSPLHCAQTMHSVADNVARQGLVLAARMGRAQIASHTACRQKTLAGPQL